MSTDYLTRKHSGLSDGVDSTSSSGALASRSNPLSAKVTSVLSASYADSDLRDALDLLDKRNVENSAETRRQLRLDVQKEVIESNGDIIKEFGHVAEVRCQRMVHGVIGLCIAAIEAYWSYHCKFEPRMRGNEKAYFFSPPRNRPCA
jgi:hypothetical protein